MSMFASPRFLNRVLLLDAGASGATALLLALGAGLLAGPLGLPEAFLRGVGLLLLPYVVAVAWIGLRRPVPPGPAWAVAIANGLWVAASIALLLGNWLEPTGLGVAFVIAQAVVVGLFAELQVIGLRRSTAPAAAL